MSQFRPPSSSASAKAPRAGRAQSPARGNLGLTSAELSGALDALYAIGEGSVSSNEFARRGVECLPAW